MSFKFFSNIKQQIEFNCSEQFDLGGWSLFIKGKYFILTSLYRSGQKVKTIIFFIQNNMTIDDIVHFLSWENSKELRSVITCFENDNLILKNTSPIINEHDGYIELEYDYIEKC